MKYILIVMFFASNMISAKSQEMMIRLSEIEIDSNYLQVYTDILKKESRASVQLEPGVIAIYPMYQKENPTQIRILEIYANKEAYDAHIKSDHFQIYKTSTLHMVKHLKLIDMTAIDPETMAEIFRKIQ